MSRRQPAAVVRRSCDAAYAPELKIAATSFELIIFTPVQIISIIIHHHHFYVRQLYRQALQSAY